MCKLFALSSTENMSTEEVASVLRRVSGEFRVTQQDGFGFSIFDREKKEPYIERYVNPLDFLSPGLLTKERAKLGWMSEFIEFNGGHFESGPWDDVVLGGPLIAHGRTSTGETRLSNTHPFFKDGWTLAHNGVVDWHGVELPLDTTCDSEHLLNCYVYGEGAVDYHKHLTGWFATLAISPEGKLHIAKCAETDLHVTWCEKWKTYIITTDRAFLPILSNLMDLDLATAAPIEPYVEIIMSGSDKAACIDFTPVGVAADTEAASKALGRAVAPQYVEDGDTVDDPNEALESAFLTDPQWLSALSQKVLIKLRDAADEELDTREEEGSDFDDSMSIVELEARQELSRIGITIPDEDPLDFDELMERHPKSGEVRQLAEDYMGRL